MDTIVAGIDLVAAALFALAATVSFRLSRSPSVPRGVRPASAFLGLATLLYTLVSLSNVLERLDVAPGLDLYEDYVEVLFVPLLAYALFSWLAGLRIEDAERYAAMLAREHEFLAGVAETAPDPILVVDDSGIPTFANEAARGALDLSDDGAAARLNAERWRLQPLAGEAPPSEPGRFTLRAPHRREEDVLYELHMPDGTRRVLSVNSTPMTDRGGHHGATIVAFRDITRSRRSG